MRGLAIATVMLAALGGTMVSAEESARTSDLPAALQALGVQDSSVVSVNDAHQVRGQTGGDIFQEKSFSISGGTAVGSTNLLEGVFGAFTYTKIDDYSTLVVEGTFGGLSGNINANADSGLTFEFGGKALQESFDFTGKFNQDFSQTYQNWLP